MPYLPHTNPDHDEVLVARLAADDLAADERDAERARAWVAECPACAELASDLRAIASATAALPPPRRTRDFRLTETDAARLRPAGWRGFVGRFGSPTFAFTRPLAAGLATLGIAGLLLATLPSGFGSASTSSGALSPVGSGVGAQDSSGEYASRAPEPGVLAPAPAASAAPAGASAAPAPGPTSAPSGNGRDVTGSPRPATGGGAEVATAGGGSKGLSSPPTFATGGGAAEAPPGGSAAVGNASVGGPSPLVVLSIALLVAGLGLGGLRIVARRIARS